MSVLADAQIRQHVTANPPLATNVDPADFTGPNSKIQASSLDLTIGEIYIPGTGSDDPGGANSPRLAGITLDIGQTAMIKTKEVLHLPPDLAGIGFPPASLSRRGLLIINPGHIDPGYRGPLHLTVINMSKVQFPLTPGQGILTILFSKVAQEPAAPYYARFPPGGAAVITNELLGKLSPDFVDVKDRAQKIADEAVKRAQIYAAGIPLLVALLTVIGALVANNWSKPELQALTNRVSVIEAKGDLQALEARIRKLESANPGMP
jgi:dCTP deaminase